ncbi:MAG TPA: DUF3413 domain-containing protein, partial [Gammaproteobacteria bacterium]|nr:DUF3413 domain-containing protein [Gammaproteobacteria bacterium]
IGIAYVRMAPDFSGVAGVTTAAIALGWSFFTISFIVQFALLFFVCGALVLLVIALTAQREVTFILSILLAAVLVGALLADAMAFALYQMHYASVAWEILKAGAMKEVILLSLPERIFLMIMLTILLVAESFIAFLVWRMIIRKKSHGVGYVIVGTLSGLFVASYGAMFVATAMASKQWFNPSENYTILKAARIIPYYNEIYNFIMPGDPNVRKIETHNGEVYFQVRQKNSKLNYPLYPLQCVSPVQPMNVLVIVIDTWRHDAMNPSVSPNIYRFSRETQQFQDHWSGGNCTESGVFSLFYSLPGNYWRAFLNQRKPPVLIDQFVKDDYQMGIFTSAPLNFPSFHKTIFNEIQHLIIRTKGNSSIERDQVITKEFERFVEKRNKNRPFFSFLFYDAAHNYCESASPHQTPFQPAVKACDRFSLTAESDRVPYVNRYRNAVYFIDTEVGKVIATLREKNLLENTMIIITGDHGEEFNDEGMNYWNHASAYTPYQLQVPLLIYWPQKQPQTYSYMTTHYDVAPT